MEVELKEMATPVSVKISHAREPELIALALVVIVAAVLRFTNLDALGSGNHYYTAAVQAMSQSWHNFFYAAAEPGGSVSVDKPPVGLWLQVLSAHFFGVTGFGVLLPQIVAGILSVIVVYYLVRRSFGMGAGLIAGLTLALTPVVVATDRNNTMDSTLLLTLLLATWAFIEATEEGKLRHLVLGALLVGIGFNIKMLAAFLPLPAFYVLYLLGSPERLWRKFGNLALATVLLSVVAFSWTTIVDLTPAEQRPYIGSSGDNSELSLITGYNGAQRLLGMGARGGLLTALFGNTTGNALQAGGPVPSAGRDGAGQPFQGDRASQGFQRLQTQQGGGGFQAGRGGPGGGAGMFNIGQPGLMRLFTSPLSKNVSWLLPIGLFSAVLLLFRSRLAWPLSKPHQALVLWGGWLGTAGVFFSVAGFYHEYYLSMLAPPLAALVGIGLYELGRIREKRPWLSLGLISIAGTGTLWIQMATTKAIMGNAWWLASALSLFCVGVVMLLPVWERWFKRAALAGLVYVVVALLLTPGIWSVLTMLHSSDNQSLPAAYDGRSNGPANQGRTQINQALLDYVQANTIGHKYLMAVPSSMQGSDYVIETKRPVLYLGGFMGQDQVVSSAGLAKLVAAGELRYIYWNARSGSFVGPGGGQADISSWIANTCTSVGFDAITQNTGAPDGTFGATGNNAALAMAPGGFGNMQVTLYDCAQ